MGGGGAGDEKWRAGGDKKLAVTGGNMGEEGRD